MQNVDLMGTIEAGESYLLSDDSGCTIQGDFDYFGDRDGFPGCYNWTVCLTCNGRVEKFEFSMGSGYHDGAYRMGLSCFFDSLFSDYATIKAYPDYDCFAWSLGYEGEEGRRAFEGCIENAEKLENLFGDRLNRIMEEFFQVEEN